MASIAYSVRHPHLTPLVTFPLPRESHPCMFHTYTAIFLWRLSPGFMHQYHPTNLSLLPATPQLSPLIGTLLARSGMWMPIMWWAPMLPQSAEDFLASTGSTTPPLSPDITNRSWPLSWTPNGMVTPIDIGIFITNWMAIKIMVSHILLIDF